VPEQRVQVSGNLKFEIIPPSDSDIAERFDEAAQRADIGPVIVAGSTLDAEEEELLQMFEQVVAQYPNALLVVAPRHPERFDAVALLLQWSGARVQRRSQWDGETLTPGSIFLLDTIGELASLYGFADLAFVGGSLVPRGGHNVLEAAQFAKPILVGPSTENFRDIVEVFRRTDALRVVTPETLATTVLRLLEDDDEREGVGRRALEVMRSQLGATEKTVQALVGLLEERAPAVAASLEKQA
jgi:3-deoxy-D-manno-octulosonic-acid transferase